MFPKDPIELFQTAAHSTLGRCYLFLAVGGLATTFGGLCATLEPGHVRYFNPFSEGESLLITLILLPVAWLGGFFLSLGHLFGVVNFFATVVIAVKLLYRNAKKRLCLLPLFSIQTMAVFLASEGSHWIAWTAAFTLSLGAAGLLFIAWIWPRLRVAHWSVPVDPRHNPKRLQLATHRWKP